MTADCELCGGSGMARALLVDGGRHVYDCPWCAQLDCDDPVHDR